MPEKEKQLPELGEQSSGMVSASLGALAVASELSPDMHLNDCDERFLDFYLEHPGYMYAAVVVRKMTGLDNNVANSNVKFGRFIEKLRGHDVWSAILFENDGHASSKLYGFRYAELSKALIEHGLPVPELRIAPEGIRPIPEKKRQGPGKRLSEEAKRQRDAGAHERLKARREARDYKRGKTPPPPRKRIAANKLPKRF